MRGSYQNWSSSSEPATDSVSAAARRHPIRADLPQSSLDPDSQMVGAHDFGLPNSLQDPSISSHSIAGSLSTVFTNGNHTVVISRVFSRASNIQNCEEVSATCHIVRNDYLKVVMEFTPTGVYSFQKELKRTEQSLAKRLKSIEKDAMFLATVFRFVFPVYYLLSLPPRFFDPLPRVANLRCGLWYQKDFDSTCYFKVQIS